MDVLSVVLDSLAVGYPSLWNGCKWHAETRTPLGRLRSALAQEMSNISTYERLVRLQADSRGYSDYSERMNDYRGTSHDDNIPVCDALITILALLRCTLCPIPTQPHH